MSTMEYHYVDAIGSACLSTFPLSPENEQSIRGPGFDFEGRHDDMHDDDEGRGPGSHCIMRIMSLVLVLVAGACELGAWFDV